jgi:hypothetical protein
LTSQYEIDNLIDLLKRRKTHLVDSALDESLLCDDEETVAYQVVLQWICKEFPSAICLSTVLKTGTLTQSLSTETISQTQRSLPWSANLLSHDSKLTNTVLGKRDGKKDAPLQKGSLIKPGRLSALYKVANDSQATEPSTFSPQWCALVGESSHTARTVSFGKSDLDSLESSYKRIRTISSFLEWNIALLASQLKVTVGAEIPKFLRIVDSIDRASADIAWQSSVGLANVLLKRRDQALLSVNPILPEDSRIKLRASSFTTGFVFNSASVSLANDALKLAADNKASLKILEFKNNSSGKAYSGKRRVSPTRSVLPTPPIKRSAYNNRDLMRDVKASAKTEQQPFRGGPSRRRRGGRGRGK